MKIYDTDKPESDAVIRFAVATEELMEAGLEMARRLSPQEFATAMAAIRAGKLRPQLVVRFDEMTQICLQGIAPDGREGTATPSIQRIVHHVSRQTDGRSGATCRHS